MQKPRITTSVTGYTGKRERKRDRESACLKEREKKERYRKREKGRESERKKGRVVRE